MYNQQPLSLKGFYKDMIETKNMLFEDFIKQSLLNKA